MGREKCKHYNAEGTKEDNERSTYHGVYDFCCAGTLQMSTYVKGNRWCGTGYATLRTAHKNVRTMSATTNHEATDTLDEET